MTPSPGTNALLVIDIQQNLVDPSSRLHIDTTNIELFFKNVNHTIRQFETAGQPIFYITNEWSNPLLNWITGNVCKKGGKGVGPDSRLSLVNDKLYRKSLNNALSNRELVRDLQEKQVSGIYLLGLFAEHCVKATLTSALKKNFKVTVIIDALGAKNDKNLRKSLQFYRYKGAALVSASHPGDI